MHTEIREPTPAEKASQRFKAAQMALSRFSVRANDKMTIHVLDAIDNEGISYTIVAGKVQKNGVDMDVADIMTILNRAKEI